MHSAAHICHVGYCTTSYLTSQHAFCRALVPGSGATRDPLEQQQSRASVQSSHCGQPVPACSQAGKADSSGRHTAQEAGLAARGRLAGESVSCKPAKACMHPQSCCTELWSYWGSYLICIANMALVLPTVAVRCFVVMLGLPNFVRLVAPSTIT